MKTRLLLLAAGLALTPAARAAQYSIDWYSVDGGGGTSSGGTYTVSGSIGQPDAAPTALTGGSYSLQGGFWPGLVVDSDTGAPALLIQLNGTAVNISWAPGTPGFKLEQADELANPFWSPAPEGNPVQIPVNVNSRYYRLNSNP